MVNANTGSHVMFKKTLELFALHTDPEQNLHGMNHDGWVMILNGVDWANHDLNDKSNACVLTSGTFPLSDKLVNCEETKLPSNPVHVLTTLQVRCKETYHTFHHLTNATFYKPSVLGPAFEGVMRGDVEIAHLHDGKMHYEMTQHVSWSSSYHPFRSH